MIVNPFREPAMRRVLGLAMCWLVALLIGPALREEPRRWLWICWLAFGAIFGSFLLFYAPAPKKPKQWRHPAWSQVPPGHCPVCKAKPHEDCDGGLHS